MNNNIMHNLNHYVLFFVLILIAHCSHAGITITSDKIEISINDQFQQQVKWLETDAGFLLSDEALEQTGVTIDGRLCREFQLIPSRCSQQRIDDPEFGPALEALIVGVYDDAALTVERQTRILLPDDFSDAVLFQTTYKNMGEKAIRIDTVFTQNFILSPATAPDDDPGQFASFQGGINPWGEDYSLIWLTPGFSQSNFQGSHSMGADSEISGGMPFIDVWNKTMGVALMHLDTKPRWLSLPVNVDDGGRVSMGIVQSLRAELGQQQRLAPEESFQTVLSAVIFHHLDYYDALHCYGDLLRRRGVAVKKESRPSDFEPYWKGWGFGFDFTLKDIYGVLPELQSMGITIANMDDGWFQYYGDWDLMRTEGKFPNGEPDMIEFVKKLHAEGFKTNLWWYPFGVSPESKLAKERPDLLVQAKDGSYPVDERGLHQLCPAHAPARDYVAQLIRRFVHDWDFDGLYTDTRGLAGVPPCYNKAHKHDYPLQSFESMPLMYQTIDETLHKYKENPYHEVCICAAPHSPYFMPYYTIANASDPINAEQTRRRIKVEKAIHGPTFCVGDCYQVPMDEWDGFSVPESFESALGTGGQLTTFYTDLDSVQLAQWQRMFAMYRTLGLASAEYVNLYDIAFDKPETHLVRKDDSLFYGFYAPLWSRTDGIQLRGLKKDQSYEVYDYINDKSLGIVRGDDPALHIGFKDNLLIKLTPTSE